MRKAQKVLRAQPVPLALPVLMAPPVLLAPPVPLALPVRMVRQALQALPEQPVLTAAVELLVSLPV